MTKPDEPGLYYLLDGPQQGFVRQMGSQASENCHTSVFVTLETGQPHVVTGMPFGIVQRVNRELLCILGLVGPEDLNIAGGTVVILGLFEMQNVIDLQVKPEPIGLVLALVGHELLCDGFVELLLGRWNSWPDLGTHLLGTDYPFELAHVLHPGHRKVGKLDHWR